MSSLFPMIQPQAAARANPALPLCREAAWDFEKNCSIWSGGNPVIVEGARAVLVWAWNALQTPRCRHEIFTQNYGCECERLIGQAYSEAVKRAEAARYVREALLASPYIEAVEDITVAFEDGRIAIGCKIVTVYGEVSLHV